MANLSKSEFDLRLFQLVILLKILFQFVIGRVGLCICRSFGHVMSYNVRLAIQPQICQDIGDSYLAQLPHAGLQAAK